MKSIFDIQRKYRKKIDNLDLELIIAHAINKTREFVLTHPEYEIPATRNSQLTTLIKRRMKHEPLAYILGEKEFHRLKFIVNKNVLIPRPETEMIVELAKKEIKNKKIKIVDIGTGSGNIIIAIAKQLQNQKIRIDNYALYGIDISEKALRIAKRNAKLHKLNKKIKFLQGNLLEPIKKIRKSAMIIVANLPYLSSKLYNSAPNSVRNYEPKIALLSPNYGLAHYEELIKQIKKMQSRNCDLKIFLEISPEQKNKIEKLIKKYFPKATIIFYKDLSGKWRVCELKIEKI